MALASRTDLQDYCLRRLGAPVIEINVDEQQVSDRVDDAIQYWQEYHFDGVERTFVKHAVTGSKVHLTTNVAANFQKNETITGGTSGASAKVVSGTGQDITVEKMDTGSADLVASEQITGSESGSVAT